KRKGFINDYEGALDGSSTNRNRAKRIFAPLSSQIVANTANQDVSKLSVGDTIGLSSTDLKATIRNFNNHNSDLKSQLKSSSSAADLASTSSFALYTESPYYYFSWFLYDNGMTAQSGAHD